MRFFTAATLVALVASSALPALAQSIEEGVTALQRGDFERGLQHIEPLADEGNAHAQFVLGLTYYAGQSVVQNYTEAAKWFRRAAEQGHADAQLSLALMYSEGWGVSRNPILAYVLEKLATAQGHEDARNIRDMSIGLLSPEQVNEGQRLATEWEVGTPLPASEDVMTWP